MRRIEYQYGDILNQSTGTIFLEEIPVEKGQLRKARCKCGYCGNEDFIITIKKAKAGQLCSKCKNERLSFLQLKHYYFGEILNLDTGSVFIEDIPFVPNTQRKAKIKCGYCGTVYTGILANAKNGELCPHCRNERASKQISEKSKEYYVGDTLENPFGEKFILLEEFYNNKNKRRCFFAPLDKNNKPLYDEKFESCVSNILLGRSRGRKNLSKMEDITLKFLESKNISFSFQQRFEDLVGINGGKLSFDFSIPLNDNKCLLIELDGEQHFAPVAKFGGEEKFRIQKINDNIKDEYVKEHQDRMFLERIPYTKINNLNEILNNIILKYNISFNREEEKRG